MCSSLFISLQHPDPKEIQINLTGFLNPKNARIFLGELWELLTSAQNHISGIPEQFIEQKKEEIKKRQVIDIKKKYAENINTLCLYKALYRISNITLFTETDYVLKDFTVTIWSSYLCRNIVSACMLNVELSLAYICSFKKLKFTRVANITRTYLMVQVYTVNISFNIS